VGFVDSQGYNCSSNIGFDVALCTEEYGYSLKGWLDMVESCLESCGLRNRWRGGSGLPSTNALSNNNCGAVSERSPFPHSTFFLFLFTNTLYPHSDGRIVAHAQATYQVQVTSPVVVCVSVGCRFDGVAIYPVHCDGVASLFPHPHVTDVC
jgi:hypothetical protein